MRLRPRHGSIAALALCLSQGTALAQAIDLDEPEIKKGEIGLRSVNVRNFNYAAGVTGVPVGSHELSASYAPLDWLQFTLHADAEQMLEDGWRLDHIGFESLTLLKSDGGKEGLALAWFTSVQVSSDPASTNSLIFGPVARVTVGKAALTSNTYIEQTFGRNHTPGYNFQYGWHGKYELTKGLGLGVEGIGKITDVASGPPLADQDHRVGPALFLEWEAGAGRTFGIDTALLFGLTHSSPGITWKFDVGTTF